MKKIIYITLIFVLAACSTSTAFDKNLMKWNDANISHYRYQLLISCFCPFGEDMPLTIEVQNGEVVSMTRPDGSLVDSSNPSYTTYVSYATIERVFSELGLVLTGEAEDVAVSYDSTYGFPVEISIDYIKEAIDDEMWIGVSNFEVLP